MEEAPNVVAAYNNLHSQGLEVVGVSLDLDENQMETVAQQRGMAWPQYFDGKAWRNAIAAKYHVNEIPALWLLDKNGMLVDTNGADHLQEKVEKLLAQQ
jgi:alkyl hydroperoxide reductase subunit AhpC